MGKFSRMTTSWFRPPAEAEPSRQPRVPQKAPLSDQLKPTVDERTADAALQILENQAFVKVFERLRTAALVKFGQSKPGAAGAFDREAAHLVLTTLDTMHEQIKAMADETKIHRRKRNSEEN